MAKKPSKPKAAPAPKKPKKAPAAVDSAASVGPIEGTLGAKPEPKTKPVAPPVKNQAGKDAAAKKLNDQFDAIMDTLLKTHEGPKQARQLRWALKSLEAARDAALHHVHHNV